MFPCCDDVYKKYIYDDGTLNIDDMLNIKVQLKLIDYNTIMPELRVKLKYELLSKICMCDCHYYNKSILH